MGRHGLAEPLNSQAPDMPELAHQGFFSTLPTKRKLLCQKDEKISPSLKPYGFYELSISATG